MIRKYRTIFVYLEDYNDNAIKIIKLGNKEVPVTLQNEPYSPSSFAISNDGKKLAYSCYSNENFSKSEIVVFDIKTDKRKQVVDNAKGPNKISWSESR